MVVVWAGVIIAGEAIGGEVELEVVAEEEDGEEAEKFTTSVIHTRLHHEKTTLAG